jgi:hypothetical protein
MALTDDQIAAKLRALRELDIWCTPQPKCGDRDGHSNPIRIMEWCLSRTERAHVYGCTHCQGYARFFWWKLLRHNMRLWTSRIGHRRTPRTAWGTASMYIAGIGIVIGALSQVCHRLNL